MVDFHLGVARRTVFGEAGRQHHAEIRIARIGVVPRRPPLVGHPAVILHGVRRRVTIERPLVVPDDRSGLQQLDRVIVDDPAGMAAGLLFLDVDFDAVDFRAFGDVGGRESEIRRLEIMRVVAGRPAGRCHRVIVVAGPCVIGIGPRESSNRGVVYHRAGRFGDARHLRLLRYQGDAFRPRDDELDSLARVVLDIGAA